MAVCKHCGTEIKNGLEYCPNCGQSIDGFDGFFEPDEGLEEEAYNIFDAPDEFDMDSLLSKEFEKGITVSRPMDDFATPYTELEDVPGFEELMEAEELTEFDELTGFEEVGSDITTDNDAVAETEQSAVELPSDDLVDLFGMFGEESIETIEEFPVEQQESVKAEGGIEFPVAEENDLFALDDLFLDLDGEPAELGAETTEPADHGLEELLAASESEEPEESKGKKKKEKKQKKEKKSLFKRVFGNVPIDPSKVKPEPTPEQIAAKKQKEAEEKKAKEEEKKLAAEEKKQIAQQNKEDKARQKALAKEEKKAKKMQEAKLILEEMKDTRINRLGATIVILFFVACAVAIILGSDLFGYTISINNAEKNFNKAYNNNVKYYTDAYNDIYGLEIKPEERVLKEKIMTVMFVNKHLNSYNSNMVIKDYPAALHSLLMGLYRYGAYYEKAIPLGIERDMDYVRTQILKELDSTFKVSEDEAELLRSMLDAAGAGGIREDAVINEDAARAYNLKLYEIVQESGLKNDSNN